MPNIGYATLTIIPTARGVSGIVAVQIIRPVAAAGRTAGDKAADGIKTGIARGDYNRAALAIVGPVARAGRIAGERAGSEIQSGMQNRNYEASGRDAAGRFSSGFRVGIAGIGAGLTVGTRGLSLFVANASTIATAFGLAARIVRGFSAATFVSALALRSVASTGLTRLAGALRIIAAIAGRVAHEIGQITAAFLVLQGVVRLASAMTSFARSLALLTVGGAAAIGVISGLGFAFASLAASVAAAAGVAAGAAAGILAPALASLKIGFSGLGEAKKAFESGDGGAGQAKAVASAAKTLADAEKNVERAKKDGRKAEEDLTQAREDAEKQIHDQNKALRDNALNERQALRDVRKARDDLAKTLADPQATGLDREEAADRVERAELDLIETQERSREEAEKADKANRAGVEGSDQVVAAKERVADANDKVAEAQQQVTEAAKALADAQSQGSGNVDPFYAMIGDRMAPMLNAFDNLKRAVTDDFSSALIPAFGNVGTLLDTLSPKLAALSGVFGRIGTEISNSLSGPQGVAAFEQMTAASHQFFDALSGGQNGLGGFTLGLAQFAATAASTVAGSGGGLNALFTQLGEKLRNVSAEQMTAIFDRVAQVFRNISAVVGPLFGLFTTLGGISAKSLAPGFSAVGNAIEKATPLLANMASIIMPALGQVMERLAPLIPALVNAFTPWSSVLATLAPPLASVLAHLAPLAPYLLLIATTVKVVGAAMLVWNAITFASSVAQGVFAAAMGRSALTLTGNTIALAAHRVALIAGAVAARAFGIAMNFATGPIGIIILAVAAIGVALWAFFTKTEVGKRLWETIWNGIKTAVSATWDFLKVAWAGILVGIQWIGDKAMWLWNNAIQPAFAGIGAVISWWWNTIVTPAFEAVKVAFGVVGDVAMWLWHAVLEPAFKAIGFAAEVWWAGAQIVWELFKIALNAAGDVVMWLWHNILEPAFSAIGAAAEVWWAGAQIVWGAFRDAIGFVGDKAMWLWHNIFEPVFDGIKTAVSGAWKFMKPIFDFIGDGIEGIGTIAGRIGETIKSAFLGVVDILKAPLRVVGGLLAKIPDTILGVDIPGVGSIKAWGQTLQALRTGGVVAGRDSNGRLWGPGTGTSDSILGVNAAGVPTALVSANEGVVTAAAMAAGGDRIVAALNAGWTPTATELHALFPELTGYATGGKVSKTQFLNQLRGIEGAAYDFGGWGNGWVTDCSGAQSKAANLIAYGDTETGGRFSTATMADALAQRGALPGLGGPEDYSIGWKNGGPGGGHAGGSLPGGIGFEMGGRRGNGQYGGAAALANDPQFTDARHFPESMFTSAGTNAATTPSTPSTAYPSPSTSGADSRTGGEQKGRLKSFEELGRDFGGIFAKGLLETFGLEDSALADPSKLLVGDTGEDARTTGATTTPRANPDAPAATAPVPSSSTGKGAGDANTAVPVDPRSALQGSALYAYDIAKVAKDMGLGKAAAVIATASGLVETGLKMYANSGVPESLSLPHDAVGSDHDSVGIQQQRASWGSVADRMNSPISAKLFFNALKGVAGWETMDPGAAAQAVQRSAFPARYSAKIAEARDWVDRAKVFDTGGFLAPGGIAVSALTKPEPLLPADKWAVAEANIAAVDRLVTAMTSNGAARGRGGRGGDTFIGYGYTAGELADEWTRRQWARTGGYDGRGW